jgi:opacity protein-like surface antigen
MPRSHPRARATPTPARALLVTLALASCAAAPRQAPVQAGPPPPPPRPLDRGVYAGPTLSFSVGQNSLDEGDYEPVEDQIALGVGLSHEPPGSFVGWELGLIGSYDEDDVAGFGDIESSTWELYGGVRKTLVRGEKVRPYVGGGVSLVGVRYEVLGFDDDDSSLAAYAHAGVEVAVSPGFALGLDLRGLFGSDIDLFGVDTDADSTQLEFFLAVQL